jgi:hypothetical protein
VVECDLAKVEVAGSNPVSRSIYYSRGPFTPFGTLRYVGRNADSARVLLLRGRPRASLSYVVVSSGAVAKW